MLRTASTQGERQDEREQNKITPADSHDTWAVDANKVLCWWPGALRPPTWMRLRKLLNVLHPVESSREPCVAARFFCSRPSIRTPRDRRKRPGGIMHILVKVLSNHDSATRMALKPVRVQILSLGMVA